MNQSILSFIYSEKIDEQHALSRDTSQNELKQKTGSQCQSQCEISFITTHWHVQTKSDIRVF